MNNLIEMLVILNTEISGKGVTEEDYKRNQSEFINKSNININIYLWPVYIYLFYLCILIYPFLPEDDFGLLYVASQ